MGHGIIRIKCPECNTWMRQGLEDLCEECRIFPLKKEEE